MIRQLENYALYLNANAEVRSWLNTTGRKAIKLKTADQAELEHILDFLVSSAGPKRLQKMSLKDAKAQSKKWSEQNQKKGRHLVDSSADIETIHDFLDGTKIVKLKTKKALQREGFFMAHCVGGYDPEKSEIYSYRDADNEPHATFEVSRAKDQIMQIKGKGNGAIHPKYIHPILAFLQSFKINVSSREMKNLGYYHIDKEQLELLKRYPTAAKQMTMISGEAYAY